MKKSKSGIFVAAFFLMFVIFMVWYFLICSDNGIAPSDFALISVAIVCAVECIVGAWIKTHGEGFTKNDEQTIEFVASIIGKILDVAPPTLKTAEKGYEEDEEDISEETDVEDSEDKEYTEGVG